MRERERGGEIKIYLIKECGVRRKVRIKKEERKFYENQNTEERVKEKCRKKEIKREIKRHRRERN